MGSVFCELAIQTALQTGNALLKFISANDVGLTGSHQCGYYLPKSAWEMFTPQRPEKGVNYDHRVTVSWQDGEITDSIVKWYGKRKSEYRLTRFGRGFPFLAHDAVGDLFVLIPEAPTEFTAFVLDLEEDIEEVQSALGVEVIDTFGIYIEGSERLETFEDCVERHFRDFSAKVDDFPAGEILSATTYDTLASCKSDFRACPADDVLMDCVEAEYRLFRLVERQLCQRDITRLFSSVDDFLKTAATIMNRRKARAGRSLENHVDRILTDAGIPHDMRPPVNGRPDVLIPGRNEYENPDYPAEKLFMIGVKTTCKDRWRQILNEANRISRKHLLTVQRGISPNQLAEMHAANIQLVVPGRLHKEYPRKSNMDIMNVEKFLDTIREELP